MPSENTALDKRAEEALDKIFYDTAVPQTRTRERLKDLRDHIDQLMENLDDGS